NKLSLSMETNNSKFNTLQTPFKTDSAECFPLNDDYILITINYKLCEIYLFDIKNKIYQLLNTIKHDNKCYKTINITKYYNKNNYYYFIILSCDYDENFLNYLF